MNAHPLPTSFEEAFATKRHQCGEPFRIITKIFGSLLGPDFIVSVDGKTFRVGELTVGQLRRGIPASELDMLEVDDETYEAI